MASALLGVAGAKLFGIEKMGLKLTGTQVLVSALLFVCFFFIGNWIVEFIRTGNEILKSGGWPFLWKVSPAFQALNEEICLRALLLSTLLSKFKSPLRVSLGAALIFSLLHFVFYGFIYQGEHALLSPFSVVNLTLFGFICNYWYLKFRHIGFPLALHGAWNLNRFTSHFGNPMPLPEAQTFNLFEGSWIVTAFLCAVFFFSWIAIRVARK